MDARAFGGIQCEQRLRHLRQRLDIGHAQQAAADAAAIGSQGVMDLMQLQHGRQQVAGQLLAYLWAPTTLKRQRQDLRLPPYCLPGQLLHALIDKATVCRQQAVAVAVTRLPASEFVEPGAADFQWCARFTPVGLIYPAAGAVGVEQAADQRRWQGGG